MRTYSVSEAAGILNVCEHTILRYIKDGTFKGAYKSSGGFVGHPPWNIPSDTINDYIESKKKKEPKKTQKHIRGSKKEETKRIMAALDEMDAAIMLLHETIGKLRTELG